MAWEDGQTIPVGIFLTSALAEPAPNTPATGAPAISGTAQVGKTLTADVSGIADEDGLDNAAFAHQWIADDADIEGATGPTYEPTEDDAGKTVKVRVSFTDDAGHEESLTSEATEAIAARPNTPATGLPVITGTAQVGETLTADTSGIADEDGLDNAAFAYQWVADDADIDGATNPTYTLADSEEGKTIKVRATFTDDAGHEESLTSEATEAIAARPNTPATGLPVITGTAQVGETLTADTSGIADEDGLDNAAFAYQWVADDADIDGATNPTYTLADSEEGKTIKVRATFTDDAGNEESLTSEPTAAVADKPNTSATGQPAISGTAQVGETLTASTTDIADEDGLENAAFSYQWIADDADIEGATTPTYEPTDDDVGKSIRVRVSFTDDAGNEESLTSAATAAVEQAPQTPSDTTQPERVGVTVDGAMLRVVYDEDLDEESTPPAEAFDVRVVCGCDDTRWWHEEARRPVEGVSVRVDAVVLTLISAVTSGDYVVVSYTPPSDQASGRIRDIAENAAPEFPAVQVLNDTEDVGETEVAQPNSPPTGLPTISGTVRVGETLTVDTSGIADTDGMDNATFSYQWVRHDGTADTDVPNATGSTYTLTEDDLGSTISIRLTFTDDAGNEESLTSEPTAAVAAKPNTPATGLPTITGTAQVGETLTADVAGIADSDGLDNAAFTYQWTADDADIDGATTPTYEPTDDDVGKSIRVRASFTDDRENEEALTSEPTAAVAAAPAALTVSLENAATTHNGTDEFTFEIRFSEAVKLSYKTLRDHAFTVTGGTILRAQRMDKPSNILWRITVRPDSNGDVTIVLPMTEDCDAQGAICTHDGRKLSDSLSFTVPGPGG